MTERRHDLMRTPFTDADWCGAVIDAWPEVKAAQAALLWAQAIEETGRGGHACWNWNLGNVKHVDGDGFDYFELPHTREVIGGKDVFYEPPDPRTRFRAFATFADGMSEHVDFLRRHYAPAWSAVESGDPREFVRLLKLHGYFTGDVIAYTNAVVELQAEFLRAPWFAAAQEARADTEPPGETDGGASRRDALSDAAEEAAENPAPDSDV